MKNILHFDKIVEERRKKENKILDDIDVETFHESMPELIDEMRKDAALKTIEGAEAFLWSTHNIEEIHKIVSKMLDNVLEVYTPDDISSE